MAGRLDEARTMRREMEAELRALSRKDLQQLAKQEGVRANGRSSEIVEALLSAAFEQPAQQQRQQPGRTHPQLPKPQQQQHRHHQQQQQQQHRIQSGRDSVAGSLPCNLPALDGSGMDASQRRASPAAAVGASTSVLGGRCATSAARSSAAARLPVTSTTDAGAAAVVKDQAGTCRTPPRHAGDAGRLGGSCGRSPAKPHQQVVAAATSRLQGLSLSLAPQRAPLNARPGTGPATTPRGSGGDNAVAAGRCQQQVGVGVRSSHTSQQASGRTDATPGNQQHVLHTPLRVRVAANGTRQGAAPSSSQPPAAAAGGGARVAPPRAGTAAAAAATPQAGVLRAAASAAAAVTPPRQRLPAFGGDGLAAAVAAAHRDEVTPAHTATAPRFASNGAGGDGGAFAIAASPRPAAAATVLGSARRVATTQSRTGAMVTTTTTTTAAAAANGPRMPQAAAPGIMQPPATPLQQPARRTVPTGTELPSDKRDPELIARVERTMLVTCPGEGGAPQSAHSTDVHLHMGTC